MPNYIPNAESRVKTYFQTHIFPYNFHKCFLGELIKVFGANFLIPNKYYDVEYDDDGNMIESNEDDYSYKDQLTFHLSFFEGTYGWNKAFKAACDECGLMDIYDDYENMDWVHSDIFDGYIAEMMIDELFADTQHND